MVSINTDKSIFRSGYFIILFFSFLTGNFCAPNSKPYLSHDIVYQNCDCDFCNEINIHDSIKTYKTIFTKKTKKQKIQSHAAKNSKSPKRTVIIYMAADNDLRPFAARNIQQMARVGSNENVTIVVHLDIRIAGNKKITRRYLIEKDQVLHIDPHNPLTQQMDSGNPATLISCCDWAIKTYPADEYDLFLWNHGTGILEPLHGKIINPMNLFVFNPATHRLDLDRTIEFMEAINSVQSEPRDEQRGVCWDDSTGHFLTNVNLNDALKKISEKCLGGKKFGIIGFDACLEQMIEIASFIKNYADVMIGSEEVELGMGWNYETIFLPFLAKRLDSSTFAKHIVESYTKTYQAITNDYTLSAINLNSVHLLEANINQLSKLLIEALKLQKSSFLRAVKESKSKLMCTYFDEPTYIDLCHFYKNLSNNLKKIIFDTSSKEHQMKIALVSTLNEGINLIEKTVIANTVGRNLKDARGISIYFPERMMHSSYQEALFLISNAWGLFLSEYLAG